MSKLLTPFGFESTTSDVLRGVDLSGKTALVTGANSGIGYETARALAGAGTAECGPPFTDVMIRPCGTLHAPERRSGFRNGR